MTKDEYIAWNIAEGNILVDAKNGKVYGTRGPGGIPYKTPKELQGSMANGYRVISIRNGATKLQCRVHRIIWVSQYGVVPEGYVVDHINNDKADNRIDNLQILTPEENSHKAKRDGLYKTGLDSPVTKVDPDLKEEICFLYEYSDLTYRQLAKIYGISKSRIGQIIKEVGWTEIGEPCNTETWKDEQGNEYPVEIYKYTDSTGKAKKVSDSNRYKALGNSICLPFWHWLMKRISAQYERPATLGSFFDGIGGFPLCWERINGPGTALFASEIDEFCIAVSLEHFGGEVVDEK